MIKNNYKVGKEYYLFIKGLSGKKIEKIKDKIIGFNHDNIKSPLNFSVIFRDYTVFPNFKDKNYFCKIVPVSKLSDLLYGYFK